MMYGQESFIFAVIHIGQRPVTVSSSPAPLRKQGISCATLSLMFISDKFCQRLCGSSVQLRTNKLISFYFSNLEDSTNNSGSNKIIIIIKFLMFVV